MKTVHLGTCGLRVSNLCLGGMFFGSLVSREQAWAQMDTLSEAGGNFVDTANAYARWLPEFGAGISEKTIGEWLRRRGNRASMVIATKAGAPVDQAAGLGRADLIRAVEGSLVRLGTDYLDLLWAHWDDWQTPLEETLATFQVLVQQGKIRYFGLSNYFAWRVARAVDICRRQGWPPPVAVQPQWSLAVRHKVFGTQVNFDDQYQALCREEGLAVVPYSPMAAGFLTGKYTEGEGKVDSPTDRDKEVRESFFSPDNFARLARVRELAARHGRSVAQIALAWLTGQSVVTVPIVGASSTEQLKSSLEAADLHLSPAECRYLETGRAAEQNNG